MTAEDIAFWACAAVAVLSAVAVVTRRNPVYGALYLLGTFLAVAVLFLVLEAPFLGVMQVLVYTGAILVLFLFVILLLNLQPQELAFDYPWTGRLLAGALVGLFGVLLVAAFWTNPLGPMPPTAAVTRGADVGREVFARFALPFELVAFLIVAAILGGLVLAKPKR